jgi:hypothetical protein
MSHEVIASRPANKAHRSNASKVACPPGFPLFLDSSTVPQGQHRQIKPPPSHSHHFSPIASVCRLSARVFIGSLAPPPPQPVPSVHRTNGGRGGGGREGEGEDGDCSAPTASSSRCPRRRRWSRRPSST